ncbi:MAG: hypothetical protein PHF33_05090 [Candidatus Delongbacteria bacterium]|jgi:hypothetical protein|nr:hypothetical protein [Candidatus Delongbacteria bacterium]MDD4205017.1 hypothetical protein [Candidatus Delongbacteria bacterium]MDY0017719.1 hypothetical protein [Candidatus Delongbacteria bacterium]
MTKQKSQSEVTYESLLAQKKELENQLNTLNAELDGSENSVVAKQINEFELEKTRISKEISITENSLEAMKQEALTLTSQISSLSLGKSKELIEAINKQRWFYFTKPKEIIFDSLTGIIWGNTDYIKLESGLRPAVLKSVKEKKIANISNWIVPSYEDYQTLLLKPQFPKLELLKVQNNLYFLFEPITYKAYPRVAEYYYFGLHCSSGDDFSFYTKSSLGTIDDEYKMTYFLCNKSFTNPEFNLKNKSADSINKKAQMSLDIFLSQKWEPIFEQSQIAEVFKKYYYKRPQLLKSLSELEAKIKDVEPRRNKLSTEFDFNVILKDYDLKKINFSALQYYRNAILWIDERLDSLDDFEADNSQLVQSMLSVQDEMMEDYKNDSDFKEEENHFFRDQKLKWRKIFDFGLDSLKDELISFRTEAEIKLNQIDDISISKNKISDLSKIEKEDRPDFYFFAEYTGNLIRKRMIKFNWFDEKSEDIIELLRHAKIWYEDYDVFKGKLKADFYGKCNKQSIDEEKFSEWFEEWTNERFLIISKLFNLISDNIEENKLTEKTILELFEIAKDYREKLDEFYLGERLNIHQKFAFVDNGELQEKFEKEIKLNDITNEYSGKIENLMFDLETSAQKIIIARWAKEWLNLQIEEIVRFIEKSKIEDLTPVFKESLQEIKKLKTQNFEVFLNDVKLYSEAVKQRQDDFNSLIFRMRKEMSGKKEKGKKK